MHSTCLCGVVLCTLIGAKYIAALGGLVLW